MAYENIATMLNIITLLFTVITVVIVAKNRDFERSSVEKSVNALLFGFFIMVLIALVRVLDNLNKWLPTDLESLIPKASTYITYLTQIETLALAPLLAVCFLVAIFLARDVVDKEQKRS